MHRFYINSSDLGEKKFTITDKSIIHQLSKVLRITLGENIIIFNNNLNQDFIYKIDSISKKDIKLEFQKELKKDSEIDFELNLFQALPNKLDKIENIVQKATEVGVTSFTLFRSDRSQKIILSENKIERLQKIIIEAVEQSGRNKIPKLNVINGPIQSIFEQDKVAKNLYFHTKNSDSTHIKDLKLEKKEIINIFVGPEGGWTDNEIQNFEDINFEKIYLGNRILRTETVGNIVAFWIINN